MGCKGSKTASEPTNSLQARPFCKLGQQKTGARSKKEALSLKKKQKRRSKTLLQEPACDNATKAHASTGAATAEDVLEERPASFPSQGNVPGAAQTKLAEECRAGAAQTTKLAEECPAGAAQTTKLAEECPAGPHLKSKAEKLMLNIEVKDEDVVTHVKPSSPERRMRLVPIRMLTADLDGTHSAPASPSPRKTKKQRPKKQPPSPSDNCTTTESLPLFYHSESLLFCKGARLDYVCSRYSDELDWTDSELCPPESPSPRRTKKQPPSPGARLHYVSSRYSDELDGTNSELCPPGSPSPRSAKKQPPSPKKQPPSPRKQSPSPKNQPPSPRRTLTLLEAMPRKENIQAVWKNRHDTAVEASSKW